MAGTRKQKETTKQSQASARTKTTSKTTQKSAQTPKNKTTRTGARASEKRRETKPQYEEDTGFLQSEAVILGTFAVCVLLFQPDHAGRVRLYRLSGSVIVVHRTVILRFE